MKESINTSQPGIITLMYHRIDTTDTDPWGICVLPENFEEHIQFLKNNFNVITPKEVISCVKSGSIPGNSICITFDDGYADNFLYAKPILEKYHCPATFFIATAFINTRHFWWDELEMIFLHLKRLPASLFLNINEEQVEYRVDETELSENDYQQHKTWKYYQEVPTSRCRLFLDIWEKLRNLHLKEIEKQLIAIQQQVQDSSNFFSTRMPMNEQQLQKLSECELFNIALHTHTHADLKGKETSSQAAEMLTCQKILSSFYTETKVLAYPYGRFDANSVEAAQRLHLDACFTTEPGMIYADSDLFTLNRYQVFDWNISVFKKQLNNWLHKRKPTYNTNFSI